LHTPSTAVHHTASAGTLALLNDYWQTLDSEWRQH